MQRLKFMDKQRVDCYLLAPQAKLDKERNKVIVMKFAVKLNADLALACDDKIQRAWEEVETVEREVSNISLRSEIENTDIDFYELPDSKGRVYQIKNCTLDGLYIEREKGTTYLYFVTELFLHQTPGLDRFALNWYGNSCFCEFVASQFALQTPPSGEVSMSPEEIAAVIKKDPKVLQHMADAVRPCLTGGIDSITIAIPGRESVTIDRKRAKVICDAADKAKKAGKS